MGSIAGPIVRFRFDQPSAKQAAQQITKTLQSQFQSAGKSASALFAQSITNTVGRAGKTTAEQFASAWQVAAAKLRAQLSTEKLGLNQITAARQKIISLAQSEANVLSRKNLLTKSELSTLRATTLEIERQKSALSGTGGLTRGTRSVVQQLLNGISARAGSFGGGFGSFAGLRVSEPLGKFAEEAAGLHLALLGVGTGAVAATAALVDLGRRGAEFAVSMRNTAEASGISIKSAVELRSVSKVLGVDFNTTSAAFRKFDREITLAMGASLPHASYEAVRAGKIFEALGVNVAQAAKDPAEGLSQLSKALSALPDGAVKSAVEIELLGRGGRDAAPLLNHFAEALAATKKTSDQLAGTIGGAAQAGDMLATATANLSNQWRTLETSLATVFVPLLTSIISLINTVLGRNSISNLLPPIGPRVMRDINGNALASAPTLSSAAANALLAQAAGGVNLGKNPGGLQSKDALAQAAAALAMDSTGRGRGGRGGEFLQPLFIGKAASEWEKYEREIVKAYEAHQKLLEQMKKTNSQLFLENSILTDLNGAIGMAIGSPDKTGAGIQKFFDAVNKANAEASKKAADAWKQNFEHLKSEIGGLFDAAFAGARSFGDALKRVLESALLSPIKEAFSTKIARLIQSIEKSIQKHSGKNSHGAGGFFAKILAALGLGGPNSIPVQTQNVTAGTVNIYGATTTIPKPSGSGFSSFFGGGGFSSLSTSLSGLGGMSLALAAPGGMAVAGSGGSNVAAPGGTVNSGGIPGVAAQASGLLGRISGNRAVRAISPLIPGAALLGAGIATRNGAATALGIGSLAGAGLTELSNLKALQGTKFGGLLGKFGAAAPGIGMMFAGNQTGGFGGAAEGALGGAMAGFELGGPIGAAIGGVAGAIMGAFGKKNNQKAWDRAVQRAANNQRITQPMTENFAFAAMNTIGKTLSTTFSQGPGGFSNSTLPANTPFWANAILGTPRGTNNQILWNQILNGINPNSPFFGGTNNPFTGGPLPNGLRLPGAPTGVFSPNAGTGYGGGSGTVNVHFNFPGMLDEKSASALIEKNAPIIHKITSQAVYKQSSGARRSISRAVNLP